MIPNRGLIKIKISSDNENIIDAMVDSEKQIKRIFADVKKKFFGGR